MNGVFLATCAACLASFCFLTLFALKNSPTVTMVKTTIQPHNDTSGTAIDTITRIRSTIAARIPNIIATQADFAARLQIAGITMERDSVSRIEIGTRFVADYELMIIAEILDVTVDWLLSEGRE